MKYALVSRRGSWSDASSLTRNARRMSLSARSTGVPLLRAAREVEPAQLGRLAVRVGPRHEPDEIAEPLAAVGELHREPEHLALTRHRAFDREHPEPALAQTCREIVEALEEQLVHRTLALVLLDRAPPHLLTLLLGQPLERFDEAFEQVALGEHQVDRQHHAEPLGHLVDARADALGVPLELFGSRTEDVLDADRDHQAVERTLLARPAQHVEEREPLLGVLGLGRVAPRRVEQDRAVGEPPVAVARAADAAHAARALVHLRRETEPRPRE
jgi:hypothetical protein